MIKNSIITALLSAALASGAWAGSRDVHKTGQFFQNIKAEHVGPLLDGSAYVSHVDFSKLGKKRAGGEVQIFWQGNGTRYVCSGFPSGNKPYHVKTHKYKGVFFHSKKLRAKYPLNELTLTLDGKKKSGYRLLRYDAASGSLTTYKNEKNRWRERRDGHLQSGLPAVTWELCPDFPSAKSLGAPVNEKQTAKFYNDLVAQDPGKRVRKPEYEAKAETVIWSDVKGKQRKGRSASSH